MELRYNLRLTLVIANLVGVMASFAHIPVLFFVALFTAQFMFVYYVTNFHRTLGFIGGMFNYMGVVTAGLVKVDALWSMAIMGSILMLVDALEGEQE